jgi:hypothetical protein
MFEIRVRVSALRDDLDGLADQIVDTRVEAVDRAICAAPMTTMAAELARCAQQLEAQTRAFISYVAVATQIASAQLTDAEVWARRLTEKSVPRVPAEAVIEMREFLAVSQERLGSDGWNNLLSALDSTFKELQSTLRRAGVLKRSRGVQTLTDDELRADSEAAAAAAAALALATGALDPGASGALVGDDADALRVAAEERMEREAAAAKARLRRTAVGQVDMNAVREMDRVLHHLFTTTKDCPLPENFGRVDPSDNVFRFGSRTIEIMPVDRRAVVKVGGGYMYFEEYCQRHWATEGRRMGLMERRPDAAMSRKLASGRAATPTISSGGSFSAAGTPTTPSSARHRHDLDERIYGVAPPSVRMAHDAATMMRGRAITPKALVRQSQR